MFFVFFGSVVILAFRIGLREYFRLFIVLAAYHEKITKQNCKVVIYNYILCWLYSMIKSIVIALILFLVFCRILLYWV